MVCWLRRASVVLRAVVVEYMTIVVVGDAQLVELVQHLSICSVVNDHTIVILVLATLSQFFRQRAFGSA